MESLLEFKKLLFQCAANIKEHPILVVIQSYFCKQTNASKLYGCIKLFIYDGYMLLILLGWKN